jgi:hypothetical protein
MKRQYLGDSKDSFKWDYLHFLIEALGFSQLQIVWMMTIDENGRDGRTPPERFRARDEILEFCNLLKKTRDPKLLANLPATTNAPYNVSLYKSDEILLNINRDTYFSDLTNGPDQILFLDPDNGFEPELRFNEKHVLYSEVEEILKRISPASVVTVFQHHRYKKFPEDLARIRQRLHSGESTAIYWHSLMFVSISSSTESICRAREINREYAKYRPVKVIS